MIIQQRMLRELVSFLDLLSTKQGKSGIFGNVKEVILLRCVSRVKGADCCRLGWAVRSLAQTGNVVLCLLDRASSYWFNKLYQLDVTL